MDDRKLRRSYDALLAQRVSVDRSNCPAPEEMQALVRGEGDEARRLTTLDHVMSCPECREDFEALRRPDPSA